MTRKRSVYFGPSQSVAVGLVAVTPLLVAYELTILFSEERTQATAGLLLRRLFALLGPGGFLIFNAALAIGFLLALQAKHDRAKTRRFQLYPMIVLEGIAYGGLLGPLLIGILGRLAPMAAISDVGHSLALGAGAAVYEEVLFRLVLIGGGCAVLKGARGIDRTVSGAILVVVSSALFSLFHHVGPGAEAFEVRVALYRFVAGLVLGALYVMRGLGVTVYSHAAYNAFVLLG